MKTNFVKMTAATLLMVATILVNPTQVNAQQDNLKPAQQDNLLITQQNDLSLQNNQMRALYNKQNIQGKQHGDQHKNVEAQRIAFITKELNLTPDEAKVFWPVYNEYDAKRHDLKKSFKETGDFHDKDIDKLTEREANQILDNQIIEAQKFLDLRKEYHSKFKTVLPAVKVLKLYDAEREFQKILIDKIRQHKQNSAPVDKK
jgi:CRISPR/Cas system CSM-associated protein Csm2 small subunit